MKGKYAYDGRMRRFYVSWYHESDGQTKKVWFYKGNKIYDERMAQKLLSCMQGDYENWGPKGVEKYFQRKVLVIDWLNNWLETVKPSIKISTYHQWKGIIQNHLEPFFTENNVTLPEIDYMLLVKLVNSLSYGKNASKKSPFTMLSSALTFAKKTGSIQAMPVFPEAKWFKDQKQPIEWLPSDRQANLLNAIEPEHQPIYWWIALHGRRPGEAMALQKEDLKNGVFHISRTLCWNRVVDTTKVSKVFEIPMTDAFLPYLKYMKRQEWWIESPFFFVNPKSTCRPRRYTKTTFRNYLIRAMEKTGEKICPYNALKHSLVTQLSEEYGFSVNDIADALDCDPRTIRESYRNVTVAKRKAILDRRIIKFKKEIKSADNGHHK